MGEIREKYLVQVAWAMNWRSWKYVWYLPMDIIGLAHTHSAIVVMTGRQDLKVQKRTRKDRNLSNK